MPLIPALEKQRQVDLSKVGFLTSQAGVCSTTEVSYTQVFLFTLSPPEMKVYGTRESLISLGYLHQVPNIFQRI